MGAPASSGTARAGTERYAVALRLRDLETGEIVTDATLPADADYADNHQGAVRDTASATDDLQVIIAEVTAYGASATATHGPVRAVLLKAPSDWAPQYRLLCDWTRDDTFVDEYERREHISATQQVNNDVLNTPENSTMSVRLRNDDERYSSRNSTGPLYGNLISGFPIRLEAINDGQTIPIWTGRCTDIREDADGLNASVEATGRFLPLSNVSIPEQEDVEPDRVQRRPSWRLSASTAPSASVLRVRRRHGCQVCQ